jgi:hypothetical protein
MTPIERLDKALEELHGVYIALDPDSPEARHIGVAVMNITGAKLALRSYNGKDER